MAVTWDPANKDSAWALSGGNLIGTKSGTGSWQTLRATGVIDPASETGVYFEIYCNSGWGNVLVGVQPAGGALGYSVNNAGSAHVYNAGVSFTGSDIYGYGAGIYASWTGAKTIGILIRRRKMYAAIDNTSIDIAWDLTNQVGFTYFGFPSDVVPAVCGYDPSGKQATLRATRASFAYAPPSGVAPLDSTFTYTDTLIDGSGTPVASASFKWAVFSGATPNAMGNKDRSGTGTTDGSGVFTITYSTTGILAGATCGLLLSDTAGTAGVDCKSTYIPIAPTIT